MKHAVTEEEAFNADEEECAICLELIEEPLQTPCRHLFCGDCIRPMLETAGEKCPICRKKVKVAQLKKPKMKEEEKKEPEKPKKKEEDVDMDEDDIHKVVFDSKLKVLLAKLEKIKREKPKEKALVFTTYTSTLKYLTEELPKRGFTFRTLSGDMTMDRRRRALEAFQKDPPTTVFLLSMRSGAVGITLTAAQHVFMLEPCLNIALYRQAVNRVYRLGQMKKVHITTFYVKDSIEESILKLNKDKNAIDFSAGNIMKDQQKMRAAEFDDLFHDYKK